jgi:ABC-type nitrate/sulfonate/bicarbonate transport system substrate-binding protein
MPFTGIIVPRAWAATHEPLVRRFLTAYSASVAWFYDDSHREEAIDIYAKASNTSREEVAESYDFFRKIAFFEQSGKISRGALQNLIEALKGLGDIPASLTVDKIVMPGLAVVTD